MAVYDASAWRYSRMIAWLVSANIMGGGCESRIPTCGARHGAEQAIHGEHGLESLPTGHYSTYTCSCRVAGKRIREERPGTYTAERPWPKPLQDDAYRLINCPMHFLVYRDLAPTILRPQDAKYPVLEYSDPMSRSTACSQMGLRLRKAEELESTATVVRCSAFRGLLD